MAVTTSPETTGTATLQQHIVQFILQHGLCKPNDRLIVAVSGGADSVALLNLLATLPDYPLQLVIAHLNHQLRGKESDADERFVRNLADQYGYRCEISRCNIRMQAKQTGQSLEEAGREARYRFFTETKERYNAAAIAVAHHADDQAETVLHRLIRGSGTTGLTAMAPRNRIDVIRPLLDVTRQDLRRHLEMHQISFREDASNSDQSFLRNRIRHELLPLLDDYTPGIVARLAATAQLLADDEALLNSVTETAFCQHAKTGPGWVSFDLTQLTELPSTLRARLFRAAITTLRGDLQRFERLHIKLLHDLLLTGSTGNQLQLPRDISAVMTATSLLLARNDLLSPAPPIICTITDTGSYDLGNNLSLSIEETTVPDNWLQVPRTRAYVDPIQAPFPWQVRPVNPGERFPLLGLSGSRAVQDILTDLKVPRFIRRCLPLVCHGDNPLWLAGACRSRHALASHESNSVVLIDLCGMEQFPLL